MTLKPHPGRHPVLRDLRRVGSRGQPAIHGVGASPQQHPRVLGSVGEAVAIEGVDAGHGPVPVQQRRHLVDEPARPGGAS